MEFSLRILIVDDEPLILGLLTDQLGSVGGWYRDFSQVSDREVIELLSRPDST